MSDVICVKYSVRSARHEIAAKPCANPNGAVRQTAEQARGSYLNVCKDKERVVETETSTRKHTRGSEWFHKSSEHRGGDKLFLELKTSRVH